MRRLLAPDGTVLLAVWDTIAQSPFAAALVEALAAVFPDGTPDFVARIPHGYHEREQITADLAAGELVPVQFEPVVLSGAAPSAALLAEGFCLGTPLRFALEQRGPLVELVPAVAASTTTTLGPGPVSGTSPHWW